MQVAEGGAALNFEEGRRRFAAALGAGSGAGRAPSPGSSRCCKDTGTTSHSVSSHGGNVGTGRLGFWSQLHL